MGVNYNPKIVTDGLVLCLDAANRKSYPGSGTTWFDLSGNGNNGALENSPVHTMNSFFTFNGSNQRVNCGNANMLNITVGSISAWFAADANNTGYNGIIAKQNAWGVFVKDSVLVTYDWGNSIERTTGLTVGNNLWNHVVMTFTETVGIPSNNAIIYLNGVPILTTTIKHKDHTRTLYVGEANASQYFGGKIASAFIYNKVLSATEIQQNFNATRGRYGI
jgi:hypothetical protein